MWLFELVIALLFAGALFALWSDRLGVPYPALLALVGALIALVPGAPQVRIDPELALALFVAPTLLDAAYDASPRDLKTNLWSVVGLAVVLVLLTIAGVAWAARVVVPGLGGGAGPGPPRANPAGGDGRPPKSMGGARGRGEAPPPAWVNVDPGGED